MLNSWNQICKIDENKVANISEPIVLVSINQTIENSKLYLDFKKTTFYVDCFLHLDDMVLF